MAIQTRYPTICIAMLLGLAVISRSSVILVDESTGFHELPRPQPVCDLDRFHGRKVVDVLPRWLAGVVTVQARNIGFPEKAGGVKAEIVHADGLDHGAHHCAPGGGLQFEPVPVGKTIFEGPAGDCQQTTQKGEAGRFE
jgi:hypothetical protein